MRYRANEQEIFLGHSVAQTNNMSEETAQLIDEEVRTLIENGEATARSILTENRDKLDLVARGLLEYETLSGEEVANLLKGIAPIRTPYEEPTPSRGEGPSVPAVGKPRPSAGPGPIIARRSRSLGLSGVVKRTECRTCSRPVWPLRTTPCSASTPAIHWRRCLSPWRARASAAYLKENANRVQNHDTEIRVAAGFCGWTPLCALLWLALIGFYKFTRNDGCSRHCSFALIVLVCSVPFW